MHSARISVCTFFFLLSQAFSMPAQAAQIESVTDDTVQLPSGRIFYRDSGGAGIPVLFLHAGSGNSMMWEYQIPAFTSAGYRFIAIDYRGADTAPGSPAAGTSTRISELVALLGLDKFHLLGTAAAAPDAVTWARLETLTIPALFITGAADLYTPPSVLRMFTDHMKHAEAQVIIESGHSAFWESPEEFNSLVLEFIGRH